MRTVRDLCTIQPGALDVSVSDQIERLDQLINEKGDGREFFDKTFVTEGMKAMLTEGFARLSGKSSQALFHLKQAMGGGKTHLLVSFGLLAKSVDLRRLVTPNIAYHESFVPAKVAAFTGRNYPNEYFWGSLASQLGNPALFSRYWTNGPDAPGEDAWLQLFDGDQPILILLDELPPYFNFYRTKEVGQGTVADIATSALSNMFSAASKKANVCVVIADLNAAYEKGAAGINHALEDAKQELGRGAKTITPVDLAGNEIYAILRKRLFASLPSQSAIDEVAAGYGRAIAEASRAKMIGRSAEAIADEISQTYPFHPKLKNLIALFKENEQFRQTRGLMELVSRLLKSVWTRELNDVYLIGPQHFDLSISEVRDKLADISDMADVIAKDLWDANGAAHAQVIDADTQNDAARIAANLVFTSSLSTAHNAVRGLTSEEILECAISPFQDAASITTALEQLNLQAWYLHHSGEGKYFFDRVENLTKLLQDLAEKAPRPQVDQVIQKRLSDLFQPTRKVAYEEMIALPTLSEVEDTIRKKRVLLILPPEGKIPSDGLEKFFQSIQSKNNLLVLTGEKSVMDNLEAKARYVFASIKAESRIPKGHAQREELERKQEQYSADLLTATLNTFDKVVFPTQRSGQQARLVSKPLSQSYNQSKPYNGEQQIEATLAADPLKLYVDVAQDFEAIRDKAQDLLWPQGSDDTRWTDARERATQEPAMPWLPSVGSAGLELVKQLALSHGKWEDLGNGYVTKKPRPKKASLQISQESEPDDEGRVRLRLVPQNAGNQPKIYVQEEGSVSPSSPVHLDTLFSTKALWAEFLVVDPSGQALPGEPIRWDNELVIRHRVSGQGAHRSVELYLSPRGKLWYSLDGTEPRNGASYDGSFEVAETGGRLLVYGKADALEKKADFTIPAVQQNEVTFDESRPASLVRPSPFRLDSRQKTFELLELAATQQVVFSKLSLAVGQMASAISVTIPQKEVSAEYLLKIVKAISDDLPASEPITLGFCRAQFRLGKELKEFTDRAGFNPQAGDIVQ
ncbi:MAG: anti-phage-associated DUF499 domain-containing protein [Spirochaetales bacterium]